MLKRTLTLAVTLLLLLLAAVPRVQAGVNPPLPVRTPGNWWAGAIPPGAESAPVLLFVAGLHQPATSWWGPTRYYGTNDMYATAYSKGWRTAFAEMADGAGGDMWANGQALADQITAVTRYFGVEQVTLVTHSKGGVDANVAAAFDGAASRIAAVISLSSPNYGSPLADLAMSRWGGWLADLLGERDAGVRSLQTGYMQWFRSVADGQTPDAGLSYYTISGNNWGPALSALRLGGRYLSAWGENDGMVTEQSAHKPGATHLGVLPLDHDALRTARAWPALAGALGKGRAAGGTAPILGAASSVQPSTIDAGANSPPLALAGSVLRGGLAHGKTEVGLPVEGGARRAEFTVLTSGPAAVTIVAPDGRRLAAVPQVALPEIFSQAFVNAAALNAPQPGEWRIEIGAAGDVGYLVVASIDSAAAATLRVPSRPLAPGAPVHLAVDLAPALAGADLKASLSLLVPEGRGTEAPSPAAFATAAEAPGALNFDPRAGARLALPQAAGVYPLAVTVSGRLADGSRFERSFATSLGVAPLGAESPG